MQQDAKIRYYNMIMFVGHIIMKVVLFTPGISYHS
jgi:hypothetical protein